jgi:hypothetical protein
MVTKLIYNDEKLTFEISSDKHNIAISSKVDKVILQQLILSGKSELLRNYQISLCSNGKNLFYLLHRRLVEPQFVIVNNYEELLQKELFSIVNSDMFNDVLGSAIEMLNPSMRVVLKK